MRTALGGAAAVLIVAVCTACTPAPAAAPPAPSAAVASLVDSAAASAAAACTPQPGPDLLVRARTAGTPWQAQQVGGGQRPGTCQDAVDWLVATAPTAPGDCLQIAPVAANPRYNVDATPAAPLRSVEATAGPGC